MRVSTKFYSILNLIFREALNLTDSPSMGVKRERVTDDFDDYSNKKAALDEIKSHLQQSAHNHYNDHCRRSRTPSPNRRRDRSLDREHREHRNGLLGKILNYIQSLIEN